MEYINEEPLLVCNCDHIDLPDKVFGAKIIDEETVSFYLNGTYVVTKTDNKIIITK